MGRGKKEVRKMRFRVGETNIVCSNLERSLHFYHDILGFDIIEREGSAVRMLSDDRVFLLLPIAGSSPEAKPYGEVSTYSIDLLVEDIASAVSYLQSHHVDFESKWEPGAEATSIRDPDGLILELIQES